MSRRVLALAVLLVLPASPALAWNSVGHMAVAKLAFDRLDDGTKVRIGKLLRQHPHDELFLAINRPEGVDAVEWAFLRAATWPDWVRPRRPTDPRGEAVTKYNRPQDHYIDKPFVLPADAGLFAGRDLNPGPDQPTVLKALARCMKELKSPETPNADRAVALCWLEHLVGDIHQPLHCTSLYSSQFQGEGGDQGGNLFGLRVGGRPIKLHLYWDLLPGDDPNYLVDNPANAAVVYAHARDLAELLRGPEYRRDVFQERLAKHPDFPAWADEGFELAKTVVYQNGRLRGVALRHGTNAPPDAPEAPEGYEKIALDLARKQMALAAYRLEDKVKEALMMPVNGPRP
jgi:hypothetical protein